MNMTVVILGACLVAYLVWECHRLRRKLTHAHQVIDAFVDIGETVYGDRHYD